MTKRHFGFPSETTRAASGDDHSSGPLHGAVLTHADNVITLADYLPPRPSERQAPQPNWERLTAAPLFIPDEHPFELGSKLFFAFVVFGPSVLVGAMVLIYAKLIA